MVSGLIKYACSLQAELSQMSREGEVLGGGEGVMSAPPSARSSPVPGKSKSRGRSSANDFT